jgi:hypothetical protein
VYFPAPSGGNVAARPLPPSGPAQAPAPTPVNLPTGVLSRSQWTRAGVARPQSINPMTGISRITVHHDGMDAFNATSQSACAARIELIRSSHLQRNARGGGKWADIGYHFIVDPAGRVWEGRSLRFQGAHVQDHNEQNIGILCLGNYERQAPTRASCAALDRFVASLMRQHNVPLSRVYTHRELNPTECPGRNLQRYMLQTRARGGGITLALGELGAGALATV